MASTWSRYDKSPQDDVEWVPFTCLSFPVRSISESERKAEGWIQQVVRFFTMTEAKSLKLRPRRFGVIDYKGRQEQVIVEFRPYPTSAKVYDEGAEPDRGGQSTEVVLEQESASSEYRTRRWAVARLARMLLLSTNGLQACVPFRYLADMSATSTPSFVLIYSAEGLYALDEAMQVEYAPSMAQRVRLALSYAQALAALHVADMVHGGFNTDNLYLRFPRAKDGTCTIGPQSMPEAEALIAGFEVARSFGWGSDKLDVEDPDLRIYLYPKRLAMGSGKERQRPSFDIFGLGMVMTEIGLWRRFRSISGYPQS